LSSRVQYGGESKLEWAGDDAYIAQADINLNGGAWAELRFRHADPNNYYAVRLGADTGGGTGPVELIKCARGSRSVVANDTYSTASSPYSVKVSVTAGDEASVWVEGTLEFDTTGVSSVSAGGVALASEKAQFAALKVGYDNNADDDIDDGGDDLVVASPFGSTSITPTHDDNGNLTFDGSFKYTYDAWNRLVKATLDDEDVVIQAAEFDGLGRRIRETVTNSGDLDGVTVYLYQGHQIIETRDGSDQVTLQVYHGTRYIDEVVRMRIKDLGRVYVHQDANWNVTALTDLMGRPIERYWYSPYGELEAQVVLHPFDIDWDGDVDSDDYDATTGRSGAAIGACRVLDADADGDVDSADQTIIAAYIATLNSDTELQRIPASTHSRRGNPFGHQGLVLDAELASYQNRARQYVPKAKRFMQRDPLIYVDSLALASYLNNNPIIKNDPSGQVLGVPPGHVEVTGPGTPLVPPAQVIPENGPGPVPLSFGTLAADGVYVGGTMYKVRDGCTLTLTVGTGGGVTESCSGLFCGGGGCIKCDPGKTICENSTCVCTNQTGDFNSSCGFGCESWSCKPTPPFNVPGFTCGAEPNDGCRTYHKTSLSNSKVQPRCRKP